MIRYMDDNKGTIALWVLAVAAGVVFGLVVYGHLAEAVLGGSGTLGTDTNNPHNFAYGSAGVAASDSAETEICIFCHSPHSAYDDDASLLNAPLWNHYLSSSTYNVMTPGYRNTPYGAPGFVNLLTSPPSQPDGASRLCMGCHDGTVAIGKVYSRTTTIAMAADACLNADGSLKDTNAECSRTITDLTTKHVVSIPMNDALITNSAVACDATSTYKIRYPSAGKVHMRPTNRSYGSKGISFAVQTGKYNPGYNYGVQCSSCHDPHQWVNTSDKQVAGFKFLVDGFNNLCADCHEPCP